MGTRHGRWVRAIASLLAVATLPTFANAEPDETAAGYVLVRKAGKRIQAVLAFRVDEPAGGVAEWIVYAPQAPALDRQRDVTTTLTPGGKTTAELSPLHRPMLLARVKGHPTVLHAKLTIRATLVSTRLRPRLPDDAPVKAALDAESAKNYTRASTMVDFKARAFQDWLDRRQLRRAKDEDDLTFARRVFRDLKGNLKYELVAATEFKASAVCVAGKTDCAGMSFLYVAALRAAGVPARAVVGRMAESEQPPAKPPRHVRAEFFARGVGWVPVDMAYAATQKGGDELAWFGNDPGDLVVMHVDADLLLDTHVKGRRALPALQGFCWFRRSGTGKGEHEQERWTVTEVGEVGAK